MSKTKYKVGDKSGYLEIVSFTKIWNEKYNRYRTFAICICNKCGKVDYQILPYNFSKQKSCGCNRMWASPPSRQRSKLYRGYKDVSSKYLYNAIQRSRKRGIDCDITLEFIWNLYEDQNRKCVLSGEPIHFGVDSRSSGATASIDRIDSTMGYIKGNIQLVHVDVNYMKHKLTLNRFIELCGKVSRNHSEVYKDI